MSSFPKDPSDLGLFSKAFLASAGSSLLCQALSVEPDALPKAKAHSPPPPFPKTLRCKAFERKLTSCPFRVHCEEEGGGVAVRRSGEHNHELMPVKGLDMERLMREFLEKALTREEAERVRADVDEPVKADEEKPKTKTEDQTSGPAPVPASSRRSSDRRPVEKRRFSPDLLVPTTSLHTSIIKSAGEKEAKREEPSLARKRSRCSLRDVGEWRLLAGCSSEAKAAEELQRRKLRRASGVNFPPDGAGESRARRIHLECREDEVACSAALALLCPGDEAAVDDDTRWRLVQRKGHSKACRSLPSSSGPPQLVYLGPQRGGGAAAHTPFRPHNVPESVFKALWHHVAGVRSAGVAVTSEAAAAVARDLWRAMFPSARGADEAGEAFVRRAVRTLCEEK